MDVLKKIFRWGVVVVALTFFAASMLLVWTYSKEPLDITQISSEEVEVSQVYKLQDATSLGVYAVDEESHLAHVLMCIPTVNGEDFMASMTVDIALPIYESFSRSDTDATESTVRFSAYALSHGSAIDAELLEQYGAYAQEHLPSTGTTVGIVLSDLEFEYLCDIHDDYESYKNQQMCDFGAFGLGCLVVAILTLVSLFRKPKGMSSKPYAKKRDPESVAELREKMAERKRRASSDEEERYYAPTEDPADLTNRHKWWN